MPYNELSMLYPDSSHLKDQDSSKLVAYSEYGQGLKVNGMRTRCGQYTYYIQWVERLIYSVSLLQLGMCRLCVSNRFTSLDLVVLGKSSLIVWQFPNDCDWWSCHCLRSHTYDATDVDLPTPMTTCWRLVLLSMLTRSGILYFLLYNLFL